MNTNDERAMEPEEERYAELVAQVFGEEFSKGAELDEVLAGSPELRAEKELLERSVAAAREALPEAMLSEDARRALIRKAVDASATSKRSGFRLLLGTAKRAALEGLGVSVGVSGVVLGAVNGDVAGPHGSMLPPRVASFGDEVADEAHLTQQVRAAHGTHDLSPMAGAARAVGGLGVVPQRFPPILLGPGTSDDDDNRAQSC